MVDLRASRMFAESWRREAAQVAEGKKLSAVAAAAAAKVRIFLKRARFLVAICDFCVLSFVAIDVANSC